MPENTTQKDTKWLITCGLLALCCFLLIAILLTLHKNNQNGRYALHVDGDNFYILDTKTSQVWYRSRTYCLDYGTIEKPAFEYAKLNVINVIKPEKAKPQRDIFDRISPDKH